MKPFHTIVNFYTALLNFMGGGIIIYDEIKDIIFNLLIRRMQFLKLVYLRK